MPRGTALVTGASGGIGLELARVLARDGYDLMLAARSGDKLTAAAEALAKEYGVRAVTATVDLARADGTDRMMEALADAGLSIDVLVNNAGFATFGLFTEIALANELEELQLNVVTLTSLTKRLLPAMLAKGEGRILNVASTAAFVPGPYMAVYYATKAYVLSFSAALAEELRDTGVTVTCLCPGPTASDFQARARMEASPVSRRPMPSAKSVAEYAVDAMERGVTVAIPGFDNRAIPWAARLLPRGLLTRIVRRIQAPRKGS